MIGYCKYTESHINYISQGNIHSQHSKICVQWWGREWKKRFHSSINNIICKVQEYYTRKIKNKLHTAHKNS